MNAHAQPLQNQTGTTPQQAKVITLLGPIVAEMGYEIVHAEVLTHRQKTLRLFIDHKDSEATHGTIGIEDCVKVTRALEEPLEKLGEIEGLFQGQFELEVSSPGVDRPLRTDRDFKRFTGRRIRVHTYRPLSAEECGNAIHQQKNPKQKNFLGTLEGLSEDGRARLTLTDEGQEKKKAKAKAKAVEPEKGVQVMIPLPLISKANLEPVFEFEKEQS